MSNERILIADREQKMVYLLRRLLDADGFGVLAAWKGEQAVQMAAREQPNLVILNVALAGEVDGFEALSRIRQFSEVPVMLLSQSGKPDDALRGYELGADDYISMPFDPKILLARARVLLRRCQGRVETPAEIVCDKLVIDQAARRVMVDNVEIYLTETEYNLLLELARHRNQVLLHNQLLEAVWGQEFRNEVSYLRSYIHILRRKLESDPSQPRLIISRPGVGYSLITTYNEIPGN